MFTLILILLIGMLGGVSVGLQSPIAGMMGQRIGPAASSLVIHASGMVLSAALLLFKGGEQIREWTRLPWYMLASGVFGLVLFQTFNVTIPRLGSSVAVALLIIGQLITGMVVDHFGWFGVPVRPIDFTRVAGIIILVIGGYLVVKQ